MTSRIALPPTRNHRQLASWVNAHKLVDDQGRLVAASVHRVTSSTDSKIAGTRFRRVGKGRRGLCLEIWPARASMLVPEQRLYVHTSSETYRKHSEAREWIATNLRLPDRR